MKNSKISVGKTRTCFQNVYFTTLPWDTSVYTYYTKPWNIVERKGILILFTKILYIPMINKETFLGTFTYRLNNGYIQNAKLDSVFLCSFFH